MNLSHIKLTNGDDIIAFVTEIDEETERVTLEHPIQFVIDPAIGTYGRKFLAFSDQKDCKVDSFHIMFINKASESATKLYIDIISRSSDSEEDSSDLDLFDESTAIIH